MRGIVDSYDLVEQAIGSPLGLIDTDVSLVPAG
jgi:hypothetical protein